MVALFVNERGAACVVDYAVDCNLFHHNLLLVVLLVTLIGCGCFMNYGMFLD